MPIFCQTALLEDGWHANVRIAVAHGRIAAVQADAEAERADDRHAIAIPGLANVHSHAFQRGLAGLAERAGPADDSFWTWREVMYQFLARMTADDVEAIAAQAYAEMLEGGFTRVGEFHYLHNAPGGEPYANPAELASRIAAAAAATGIGLTLLPCFYAQGGFATPPSHGQRRFVSDLDGFAELFAASEAIVAGLPDASIGVAPHSLRAVSAAQLAELVTLHPSGPVHIHAAEQTAEVDACLAATGQRPVEWLLARHDIGPRWCFIHGTHMSKSETVALAASGAVVGLCPLTEANLGDGIFPGPLYAASGGHFGIGTDANIRLDTAAELRQLEYAQRLATRRRNVLATRRYPSTGRAIFEASRAGGQQALGQAGPAGLVVGASADIVTLDARHPALMGRTGDQLLDGWIFAAGAAIDCVYRAGRRVVQGGRHIHAEPIAAAYAQCLHRLLA